MALAPLLAFVARHWNWWPSILTTLDGSGKPTGEFVNSGWIYAINVVEGALPPLILAGGVSNSEDAGMLAVLDADHATGTSPEDPASPYACRNCKSGAPLRYIVFPRSEINLVTASQYNRVDNIQVMADRVVVNTRESAGLIEQTEGTINALYEFTLDMKFRPPDLEEKELIPIRRNGVRTRIHPGTSAG